MAARHSGSNLRARGGATVSVRARHWKQTVLLGWVSRDFFDLVPGSYTRAAARLLHTWQLLIHVWKSRVTRDSSLSLCAAENGAVLTAWSSDLTSHCNKISSLKRVKLFGELSALLALRETHGMPRAGRTVCVYDLQNKLSVILCCTKHSSVVTSGYKLCRSSVSVCLWPGQGKSVCNFEQEKGKLASIAHILQDLLFFKKFFLSSSFPLSAHWRDSVYSSYISSSIIVTLVIYSCETVQLLPWVLQTLQTNAVPPAFYTQALLNWRRRRKIPLCWTMDLINPSVYEYNPAVQILDSLFKCVQ